MQIASCIYHVSLAITNDVIPSAYVMQQETMEAGGYLN